MLRLNYFTQTNNEIPSMSIKVLNLFCREVFEPDPQPQPKCKMPLGEMLVIMLIVSSILMIPVMIGCAITWFKHLEQVQMHDFDCAII